MSPSIRSNITGRETIRGSMWISIAALITFFLGLLTSALLARLLDKELFGVFAVCVAVASLLATICDLGLNSAVRYFASFFSAKKQEKKLASYISVLLKYKIYMVVAIALFMYLFSNSLASTFHSPQAASYFELAALYMGLLSVFGFLQLAIGGLKLFGKAAFISFILSVLKFILVPALVFYGFGISGALLGFVIATGIVTMIMVYWLRGWLTFKPEKIDLGRAVSYSLYAGIGGVASTILIWTDSIMLGLFLVPVFVGFYRIAITLSLAVSGLISSGISGVLFPSLTTLEARGDRKRLQRYFDESVKYGAFVSIPASFGLALVSGPLVLILFGVQYASAISALVILSPFPFAALMSVITNAVFKSLNKPVIMAKIFTIMAVLNIALNAVLIPVWGIDGAATATISTWLVGILISAILLKKKLNISFNFKHLIRPLIASMLMFLALYPTIGFVGDNVFYGVAVVGAGIVIYLALSILLGFPVKEFFNRTTSFLRK